MRYLVCAMLLVVGLIHLLPASGVLGSERLAGLYGIATVEAPVTTPPGTVLAPSNKQPMSAHRPVGVRADRDRWPLVTW